MSDKLERISFYTSFMVLILTIFIWFIWTIRTTEIIITKYDTPVIINKTIVPTAFFVNHKYQFDLYYPTQKKYTHINVGIDNYKKYNIGNALTSQKEVTEHYSIKTTKPLLKLYK